MEEDNIKGGMWGLLIGDAFGVPYEFCKKHFLPKNIPASMASPKGFEKTYPHIAFGTWSDDGAQALCLAASLLEKNKLDSKDLGKKLVNWLHYGYMAADNCVFDCGITTQKALQKIANGTHPLQAGEMGNNANGNGSLMRVLPLALWHKGTDLELILDAHLQSRVTHGHIISQVCCALYCLWARKTSQKIKSSWNAAISDLRKYYNNKNLIKQISNNQHLIQRNYYEDYILLRDIINQIENYQPNGTGFVIDCLASSKKASEEKTFSDAIVAAVKFGNDTDTTAAVTGGIVGLRDGFSNIPKNLYDELRGKDIAKPLIDKFCRRILNEK